VPDLVRSPRFAPTTLLAGAALGAAYLWGTNPHEPGHLLPVCPFHALTGLQCPACGGTRMVYDAMHGDLSAAWRDNALLLVLAPVLLWLLGRWVVAGWRGETYRVALPRYGVPVVLAVALTWGVLRNL
jgi:hypothetical protein